MKPVPEGKIVTNPKTGQQFRSEGGKLLEISIQRPGVFETALGEITGGAREFGQSFAASFDPQASMETRLGGFTGPLRMMAAPRTALATKASELSELTALEAGVDPKNAKRLGMLAGGLVAIAPSPMLLGMDRLVSSPMIRAGQSAKLMAKGGFLKGEARGLARRVTQTERIGDIRDVGRFLKESQAKILKTTREKVSNMIEGGLNDIPPDATRSTEPLREALAELIESSGLRRDVQFAARPPQTRAMSLEARLRPDEDEVSPETLLEGFEALEQGLRTEVTARQADALRRQANFLLYHAGERVDRATLAKVRSGMDKVFDQFSDEFPEAVSQVKEGLETFRNSVVPLEEKGRLMSALVRGEPGGPPGGRLLPSLVVQKGMRAPVEDLEDITRINPAGAKKLANGILERIAQRSERPVGFGGQGFAFDDFVKSVYNEETFQRLKILNPEIAENLTRLKVPLTKAGSSIGMISEQPTLVTLSAMGRAFGQVMRANPTGVLREVLRATNAQRFSRLLGDKAGTELLYDLFRQSNKAKLLDNTTKLVALLRTEQIVGEEEERPAATGRLGREILKSISPPGTAQATRMFDEILGRGQ